MNTIDESSCIAVFDTHQGAELAIADLQHAGFDMKKLSIVGRDYHTEEHAVGFYNAGDRVRYWGKNGAFWAECLACCLRRHFFGFPGLDRS